MTENLLKESLFKIGQMIISLSESINLDDNQDDDMWVTATEASKITGCSFYVIRQAGLKGRIQCRTESSGRLSYSVKSLNEFKQIKSL